jgi:hypothetical protein
MLSILRRTQEHRPNAVELLDESRNGQSMEGSWRGMIAVPAPNLRECTEERG